MSTIKKPRVWFDRPCWYWYGWRTLIPLVWGSDEWHRRDIMLGWTVTGRVTFALWRFNPDKCDGCGPMCEVCGRMKPGCVNGVWECWDDCPAVIDERRGEDVAHGR